MKLSIRKLALFPCLAAFLSVAAVAHAASFSVNGSVWEGGASSSAPAAGSSIYGTTPSAIFSVSNSSATNLFNFDSRVGSNNSANYTLSSFLTSGGDSLLYVTGSSHGGDTLNNDLFQFTGSTTLTTGTYNVTHDDGLRLYLNGVDVFGGSAAGPTSPTPTPFTVCASGCDAMPGTYSFALDYAEVFGPPAVLDTNLPLTSTPEPSSFLLLGTGLFAAAGLVRRRLSV